MHEVSFALASRHGFFAERTRIHVVVSVTGREGSVLNLISADDTVGHVTPDLTVASLAEDAFALLYPGLPNRGLSTETTEIVVSHGRIYCDTGMRERI